jgi:hypothetical protein
MLDVELKSIMASSLWLFPGQVVLQIRERVGQRVGRRRHAAHRRVLACLVVRDHCLGVASDDGVDHLQRLGFGVVAQRLGEADLARCLAEGLEALLHRGQFDIRRIDHGDLLAVDATFLDPQPVAVQRVKRVLAALRAEHPVDG